MADPAQEPSKLKAVEVVMDMLATLGKWWSMAFASVLVVGAFVATGALIYYYVKG
jgi:hypothetical protein